MPIPNARNIARHNARFTYNARSAITSSHAVLPVVINIRSMPYTHYIRTKDPIVRGTARLDFCTAKNGVSADRKSGRRSIHVFDILLVVLIPQVRCLVLNVLEKKDALLETAIVDIELPIGKTRNIAFIYWISGDGIH